MSIEVNDVLDVLADLQEETRDVPWHTPGVNALLTIAEALHQIDARLVLLTHAVQEATKGKSYDRP